MTSAQRAARATVARGIEGRANSLCAVLELRGGIDIFPDGSAKLSEKGAGAVLIWLEREAWLGQERVRKRESARKRHVDWD